MSNQSTTTMRELKGVRVLSGAPKGQGFAITFEGNVVGETTSMEIAKQAKSLIDSGARVDVELEGDRILQMRLVTGASKEQGLARPAAAGAALATLPPVPTQAVTNANELLALVTEMSKHYHLLTPVSSGAFVPGYGARFTPVVIDADVNGEGRGTDTYKGKHHAKDERALSKTGLLKIMHALGVVLESSVPRHGAQPNYWFWQHSGYVILPDGQHMPITGSRELDLRDGSAEAAGMSAAQLRQQRAFGNEICESKSMLRMIRNLGIRQVYNLEELKKPFLAVRFQFVPDMDDPDIKRLVTEKALASTSVLFSKPEPAALPAAMNTSESSGTPSTPAPSSPAATSQPPGENPFAGASPAASANGPQAPQWPADAKFIAETKALKSGEGKNGKWTLYLIAATTGESWKTFEAEFVKDAEYAKGKGWPVRIVDSENERYPDQRDIVALTILDPRQQGLNFDSEEKL